MSRRCQYPVVNCMDQERALISFSLKSYRKMSLSFSSIFFFFGTAFDQNHEKTITVETATFSQLEIEYEHFPTKNFRSHTIQEIADDPFRNSSKKLHLKVTRIFRMKRSLLINKYVFAQILTLVFLR